MTPLDFTCPVCMVAPGEMCDWGLSDGYVMPRPHPLRIEMAAAHSGDGSAVPEVTDEAFVRAVEGSGVV